MNQAEYIKKLNSLLKKLPKEEREDIISDYQEHFMIGVEKGRTEEEIASALGDPSKIARQIRAEYLVKRAEDKQSAGSMLEAILAAAGLGIFNLIFVALPALILLVIIVGLFILGGAMIFGGFLMTVSYVLHPLLPQFNFHLPKDGIVTIFGGLLSGIGLTVAGLALVAGMAYITKWVYALALRYLKFNLKVIEGKKGQEK